MAYLSYTLRVSYMYLLYSIIYSIPRKNERKMYSA